VQRGDQWATTSRYTNNATGRTTRVTQGSGGGEAISNRGRGGGTTLARSGSGDVYAGHDGNVYRKEGGGWQQYNNGGWNNVDTPQPTRDGSAATAARDRAGTASPTSTASSRGANAGTMDQLNRDYGARSDGAQRTRDYGSYQRSSGSSSAGSSYRGGGSYGGSRGGGARGGGGRRR